jgi:hypothetical protein
MVTLTRLYIRRVLGLLLDEPPGFSPYMGFVLSSDSLDLPGFSCLSSPFSLATSYAFQGSPLPLDWHIVGTQMFVELIK